MITFFSQVFWQPAAHKTAIMVMVGAGVASILGLLFLIKQVYEKCCPDRMG